MKPKLYESFKQILKENNVVFANLNLQKAI